MTLSDEKISEFQALYKGEFGVDISPKEAQERGVKLLRLISIVCKQTNEDEQQKTA